MPFHFEIQREWKKKEEKYRNLFPKLKDKMLVKQDSSLVITKLKREISVKLNHNHEVEQ